MAITSKLILEQSDTTHDSPVEPGKILVRTDEGAIYVDTDAGERVRVGDIELIEDISAVLAPVDGKLYCSSGGVWLCVGGELKPLSLLCHQGSWMKVVDFSSYGESTMKGNSVAQYNVIRVRTDSSYFRFIRLWHDKTASAYPAWEPPAGWMLTYELWIKPSVDIDEIDFEFGMIPIGEMPLPFSADMWHVFVVRVCEFGEHIAYSYSFSEGDVSENSASGGETTVEETTGNDITVEETAGDATA